MTDVVTTPPIAVLKARGVPVKLHVLERNAEGRWVRTFGEAGDPVLEDRYVQMTNAVLADIESPLNGWGSADAWRDALQATPRDAMQRTLALCLDWWAVTIGMEEPDSRRAGVAMLDAESDAYASAVGAAYMLANGVVPERVGEVMAAGIKSAAELRNRIMGRLADTAEAMTREAMEASKRALDELDQLDAIPTSPNDPPTTPSEPGSPSGTDTTPEPSTSSGP